HAREVTIIDVDAGYRSYVAGSGANRPAFAAVRRHCSGSRGRLAIRQQDLADNSDRSRLGRYFIDRGWRISGAVGTTAEKRRDGMVFRRCLTRGLFGCAIALALSAPAFAAPAEPAKPAAAVP